MMVEMPILGEIALVRAARHSGFITAFDNGFRAISACGIGHFETPRGTVRHAADDRKVSSQIDDTAFDARIAHEIAEPIGDEAFGHGSENDLHGGIAHRDDVSAHLDMTVSYMP